MLPAVSLLASLALSASTSPGAHLPSSTVHLTAAAAHRCLASTGFLSGVRRLSPHNSAVPLQSLVLDIQTRHEALHLFSRTLKDQWYDLSTYLPLHPSELITYCIPKQGV